MTKKDFDDNRGIWVKLFGVDNHTLDALYADIVKRNVSFDKRLLLTVKPWFVWLVSLFERLVTSNSYKEFDSKGTDFVFITCPDPVHRVKTLSLIAGNLKFTKFFLPSTTRPTVVKQYYNYYKQEDKENVFFGIFSSDDIRNYKVFLKENKEAINSIRCHSKEDTIALKYHVMRYALYSIYANRAFAKIENKSLWMFEHDKFFFIPVVEQFRKKGVTTIQMQHGTFFNPNTAVFIPLYTNKIMCCSKREKSLYMESGVKEEDIYVVGAPLQTIVEKKDEHVEIKYDILVLLTASSIALSIMETTLKYLREHFSDKKILLRFRPRSKDIDIKALSHCIKGFSISEGTSLHEDISSSQRVMSFSEDANFEIISTGKKFISFVNPSCLYGNYLDGICYTIENIEECMTILMSSDDKMCNDRYVEVYGETNLKKIAQNFNNIITQLKACNYEN